MGGRSAIGEIARADLHGELLVPTFAQVLEACAVDLVNTPLHGHIDMVADYAGQKSLMSDFISKWDNGWGFLEGRERKLDMWIFVPTEIGHRIGVPDIDLTPKPAPKPASHGAPPPPKPLPPPSGAKPKQRP